MFNKVLIFILFLFFLTGCATSQKIDTVKVGDNKLSCSELMEELKKLEDAQADVDSKKGFTGTNVAAALFWIPGLAYTYYDAGQAIELIAKRKAHLTRLYNDKGC
jgi:outer membrane lipoprotein-sorting protein